MFLIADSFVNRRVRLLLAAVASTFCILWFCRIRVVKFSVRSVLEAVRAVVQWILPRVHLKGAAGVLALLSTG